MKPKHLALISLIPFFSTYACHQSGTITNNPHVVPNYGTILPGLNEDVTGLSLTAQFNAGILQQKIILKEIDPHTLIHEAILENSPEVIQFLLNQGVSIDYPNQNGMSPLTIAILNRSYEVVKVLLDRGANPNPPKPWNDMGLLEIAMNMKDSVSTLHLIEKGGNVNIRDRWRNHIFGKVLALIQNSKDEWFLVAEAMIPKLKDLPQSGTPPLYLVIDKMRNYASIGRPLLELMFKNGLEVNAVSNEWDTILIASISWGCDFGIVKWIIESGADVNLGVIRSSGEKISPITAALNRGDPEIVQYLLRRGARL